MMKLILASQSPRRRKLVGLLGYPVQLAVADADEESITDPDPAVNALETTRLKTETIASRPEWQHRSGLLLAADTNVATGGHILGKPRNVSDATRMLQLLRGKQHQVHTGVVLIDLASGVELSGVHAATVTMRAYSDAEIAAYVATGDPFDKAGSYAIQHPVFQPVAALDGCYLGVVGLSLCYTLKLLKRHGYPIHADLDAVHAAHQGYACPVFAELAGSAGK